MFFEHEERDEGETMTIVNDDIKRTKVMVTVDKSGSYVHVYDLEGRDSLVVSVITAPDGNTTIEDNNGFTRLSFDSNGKITFGPNTNEVDLV